jgi:arsenate reductase
MYIVYGIPNCSTVKKVITWLDEHQISYRFHNYKTEGITKSRLTAWSKQKGWEPLVNKKGTTWRQLDEAKQATITNQANAVALMQELNSIIKRPVIEKEDKVVAIGFDEKEYGKIFL